MAKSSKSSGTKSGSGSIGGVSFSYSSSGGKTTYNVGGKSYNSAQSAANAIKSSSGYDSSKGLVRGSSSGGSSFVDPSVLHDQHMGMSNEDIAKKWGGTDANGNSGSSTAGGTKVLQALNKNNRVYGTGGYTEYNPNTGLYSKPSSSSSSSTAGDVVGKYGDASYKNYTNAFNNYKSQGMSDEDARSQASKLLENENLLNSKSDDDIAIETQNSEEDVDTTDYDELFNGADEDWRDDYFYDRLYSSKEWNDLTNQVSDLNAQLQANEVKETVPEVKDETYNYNTYFNDNLADKTMHEGGESKDIQDSGLTFAQTIQEPTTNALQDLGLLGDNEETANEFLTEQPQQNAYSSGEEVVNAFNNAIQMALNPENGNTATDKSITKLYSDYKKQLMIMLNNKQITPEQFKDYLGQIRNNEQLQTFINNYANNKGQMS